MQRLVIGQLQRGDVLYSTREAQPPLVFDRLIERGTARTPAGYKLGRKSSRWKMGRHMLKALGYTVVKRDEQTFTLSV